MTTINRALIALTFALLSPFASAATDCDDLYAVSLSLKPGSEKFWLSPAQQNLQLKLPFEWNTTAGNLQLALKASRVSTDKVNLTFLWIDPSETTSLLAELDTPTDDSKQLVKIAVDTRTGDVWTASFTPVCKRV